MRFKEFMNTCSTAYEGIYIYTTDDDWEAMTPERTVVDLRELRGMNDGWIWDSFVDGWEVDANLVLHVLLSR